MKLTPPTTARFGRALRPLLAALLLLSAACGGGSDEVITTTRVSVSSNGVQADNDSSRSALSGDGRYVVFDSLAANLVAGDTNGLTDIFLHDTETGITTRLSVDSNGVEANGDSLRPDISDDGRYVVFESLASNLVASDSNGFADIYLHDTTTGITSRVSTSAFPIETNNHSRRPRISGDGSTVVFTSLASNLISVDLNNLEDLFIYRMANGTTERISLAVGGGESNGVSNEPSISNDGRYVAMLSAASNLVVGDTNNQTDIFVRDTVQNSTRRVWVNSEPMLAPTGEIRPEIGGDGRMVAFSSTSDNVVAGDDNASRDVFVVDVTSLSVRRVSLDSFGGQVAGDSFRPHINGDSRFVVFGSDSAVLVPGDTNNKSDVFVHDLDTANTRRVSLGVLGTEGTGLIDDPAISDSGEHVVFRSQDTALVTGDDNLKDDIFRALNTLFGVP